MKFTILGMGIWGRGLQGAGALGEVVRGASAIVPETEFVAPRPAAIPAREQRRAGLLVNLAVMVAHEACENAGVDKTLVPSVFASALGDTDVTDYMCRKLTQTEKLLSPTRFHNSVHNAAAGYWSISAANHAPSTFVGGFVNSVGAGLLEAVTQARAFGQPTLLVCYDIANRQPFADLLPVGESLACALVIGGEAGEQAASQAGIDCELAYVDGQTSPTPPSTPALAQLASANPVGQALSLCEAVVRVCGPGFAGGTYALDIRNALGIAAHRSAQTIVNGVLNRVDVCILGGGLAGQTLARQLRQRAPSLDIVVLEHRRHPFPEGAHKVGESTVEIASAYLAGTLGLEAHLREAHLPKFGLRMFLRGETPISDDLACYDEIGVSRVLPIPTYQIDRGRLENHLTMLNRQAGVSVLDGTTIRSVSTSVRTHLVTLRSDAGESTIQARYLVDATGRRAFLRSQTGLSRAVRHRNHAIWLRVEGALDIDRWSNDAQWAARCHGKSRRLSTNHFTGPGYWVWLIPLASGCTSVGLVFDPTLVDLDEVSSHAGLLDWLRREHPLVAAALENRSVLDFHVLKSYAVGSRQLFHEDGWMLTGDAGVFSDPFYSPGSDFIAFANGFITELIASAADAETYAAFQRYFLSFFANTLSIYRGQYGGFGDRDLMALKTVWDYAYYWGALAKLFFCKGYADGAFMAEAHPELLRASVLNTRMQRLFRDMSRRQRRCGGEGGFFDHHEIGSFHTLKQQLLREDSHGAATGLRTVVNYLGDMAALLETVAGELAGGARLPAASRFGQVPLVV